MSWDDGTHPDAVQNYQEPTVAWLGLVNALGSIVDRCFIIF